MKLQTLKQRIIPLVTTLFILTTAVDLFITYGNMTHQAVTKSSNGFGIYDMSGNVFEWVQNKYNEYTY